MSPDYLTVSDVGRLCARSADAVRLAVDEGRLAAIRTAGGIRLVTREDALRFRETILSRNRKTRSSEEAV